MAFDVTSYEIMQSMHFGTDSQGEAIEVFSLSSSALQVRITNYGARLLSVVYGDTDVVHGPKTADELEADTCYCGSICGRVANRIAGGEFELDGKQFVLAVNNGPNHLHGGLCGFSDRVWRVEVADETQLVLSLVSVAGEEGYPGTVRVLATYSLKGDTLSLKMEAETDSRTPLNLTNHVYWNLTGSGTVDAHTLQVFASAYTPMVANIPTGSIVPVAGTLYDLRTPACLGQRNAAEAIAGGYDDNYVLPAYPGVKPAAVLSDGTLELVVATDAPGMQVYTGDYLPLKRGGIALEAQNYPDSLHHPHFPSVVLNPGEAYCRTICWQLRRIG